MVILFTVLFWYGKNNELILFKTKNELILPTKMVLLKHELKNAKKQTRLFPAEKRHR